MEALSSVVWAFGGTKYPSRQAFAKAVAKYQMDVLEHRNGWNPDAQVADTSEIEVCYRHWRTPNMTQFPDERPAHNRGGDQLETIMRIISPDDKPLTANEVLFQLHERLRQRELGDHVFFEGLTPLNYQYNKPLFLLRCGS